MSLMLLLVNLDRILVSLMLLLVKHRNEHAFLLCYVRCMLNLMKSSLY
ncbi:hypothetical protein JMN23_12985 [Bacillus sp. RHFB]|nr:hypothetical protein [Bacillus sp. RHFB]